MTLTELQCLICDKNPLFPILTERHSLILMKTPILPRSKHNNVLTFR